MKASVRMLNPTFIRPVLRKSGVLKINSCMMSLESQNTEMNPQIYLPVSFPLIKSSGLKVEKRPKLKTIRKMKNP
jgi:hypothetical protein